MEEEDASASAAAEAAVVAPLPLPHAGGPGSIPAFPGAGGGPARCPAPNPKRFSLPHNRWRQFVQAEEQRLNVRYKFDYLHRGKYFHGVDVDNEAEVQEKIWKLYSQNVNRLSTCVIYSKRLVCFRGGKPRHKGKKKSARMVNCPSSIIVTRNIGDNKFVHVVYSDVHDGHVPGDASDLKFLGVITGPDAHSIPFASHIPAMQAASGGQTGDSDRRGRISGSAEYRGGGPGPGAGAAGMAGSGNLQTVGGGGGSGASGQSYASSFSVTLNVAPRVDRGSTASSAQSAGPPVLPPPLPPAPSHGGGLQSFSHSAGSAPPGSTAAAGVWGGGRAGAGEDDPGDAGDPDVGLDPDELDGRGAMRTGKHKKVVAEDEDGLQAAVQSAAGQTGSSILGRKRDARGEPKARSSVVDLKSVRNVGGLSSGFPYMGSFHVKEGGNPGLLPGPAGPPPLPPPGYPSAAQTALQPAPPQPQSALLGQKGSVEHPSTQQPQTADDAAAHYLGYPQFSQYYYYMPAYDQAQQASTQTLSLLLSECLAYPECLPDLIQIMSGFLQSCKRLKQAEAAQQAAAAQVQAQAQAERMQSQHPSGPAEPGGSADARDMGGPSGSPDGVGAGEDGCGDDPVGGGLEDALKEKQQKPD